MAGPIAQTIGTQAGIVAQSQQASHVKPTGSPDAAKTLANNSSMVGQAAAIVSLSGGFKKGRSISTTDNPAVDGTFEKQETHATKKENEEKKEEGEGVSKAGAMVNVEA